MGMPDSSRKKLATCHPDLVELGEALAAEEDIIVIEGARTLARQKELLAQKLTKTLDSKHLTSQERPLSHAFDLAPAPLDWKDTMRFYAFGERVLKKAHALGIKLRWGGDWDGDGDYKDQKFNDLVHFELVT